MLRFRRRPLLVGAAALATSAGLRMLFGRSAGAGAPERSVLPAELSVAMLTGDPAAGTSRLHVVGARDGLSRIEPVEITHRAGSALRAAMLPGGEIAVIADAQPGADLSFAARLSLVAPGQPPLDLAGRVVHASRPVVVPDGRLLISRGKAGPPTGAGAPRVDDLEIALVEPTASEPTSLASARGFLLFVAGVLGGEAFVYRILEGGADLIAIDLATRKARTVVPALVPFARDFVVDPKRRALWFVDRHPSDSARWELLRLDVDGGTLSARFASRSMAIVPGLLGDGSMVVHQDARPLRLGPSGTTAAPLDLPIPGIVNVVDRAEVAGSTWLLCTATEPGKLARTLVLTGDGELVTEVRSPERGRAIPAGFLRKGAA